MRIWKFMPGREKCWVLVNRLTGRIYGWYTPEEKHQLRQRD